MKFVLYLITVLHDGTLIRHEPTQMDWWTCRVGELRQSANWTGHYEGNRIIGAVCIRVEDKPTIALRQCSEPRGCA